MKKYRNLTVALAVVAIGMASCSKPRIFEGTVTDASMNTVTVATAAGDTVTFGTFDAEKECPAGILIGSPVTVAYKGEIKDSFASATKVSAPGNYNLLVGEWVQPNPIDAEKEQGFRLFVKGEAESVGMATLLYRHWSVQGNELTLEGESLGNGQTIGFSEVWVIEHIDDKGLTIRMDNRTESYTRKTEQ